MTGVTAAAQAITSFPRRAGLEQAGQVIAARPDGVAEGATAGTI